MKFTNCLPTNAIGRVAQSALLASSKDKQHYKAFAVTSRLEAIAKVLSSGELPQGLAPETDDGGRMIAEPVFLAAAKEPILFTEKEPFFNAQSFIEFILRNTEADGHA